MEAGKRNKIIIGSVLGIGLLVGAGFGINYLMKNSEARKAGSEGSGSTSGGGGGSTSATSGGAGGGRTNAIKVGEVRGVTAVGGRPDAILATQGRG